MKTPESTSKDNGLMETARVHADRQRASERGGDYASRRAIYESGYRGYYADKPDKDTREGLSGYVRAEYVSDDLTKVDRTDPADLSKPFELTIGMRESKARLHGSGERAGGDSRRLALPDAARRTEAQGRQRREEEGPARTSRKSRAPRIGGLTQPFNVEWNYRSVPPAGFIPKELPKDATIQVGPALLTESFPPDKNGAVLAHLAFDTVKRRYTVAEATALRNKVAELDRWARDPGEF